MNEKVSETQAETDNHILKSDLSFKEQPICKCNYYASIEQLYNDAQQRCEELEQLLNNKEAQWGSSEAIVQKLTK